MHIIRVKHNLLNDFSVSKLVQSSEYNSNRNILFDIGDCHINILASRKLSKRISLRLSKDGYRHLLWSSIWSIYLRSYFSTPIVLWGFLLKHIDKVGSHSFLCHNDLLATIDDEVSSLIIVAFFDFILLHFISVETAVSASHHDWHLSYLLSAYFALILDDLSAISKLCLLHILHININGRLICDVSESSFMWKDDVISFIFFSESRTRVDGDLSKMHFKESLRVLIQSCSRLILMLPLNRNHWLFLDDLLNCELHKSVKWRSLLTHKPMLQEIGSNDRPSIFLSNVVRHLKYYFCL